MQSILGDAIQSLKCM